MFVYCSEVSCQEPVLMTPDGRKLHVRLGDADTPPIVIDPLGRINGGRPTSVYDILYEQHTGGKLPRGRHAVPVEGSDWTTFDPSTARTMTAAQLHKAQAAKVSANLPVIAKIKSAYYKGDGQSIDSMAKSPAFGDLSRNKIRDVVQGRIAWYA